MKAPELNTGRALTSAIWLGIIGSSVLLVLPIFVGTLISRLEFTASQAGLIGSADLMGYAASSFLAFRLVRRYSWRSTVVVGLCLMVVGNLLSLGTTSFWTLFSIRLSLTGIGAGLVICIPYTLLGDSAHPERNTSIYFGANVLGGTVGLFLLPYVVARFGGDGLFLLLFVTALSGIPLTLLWLPDRGMERRVAPESNSSVRPVIVILIGIAVFNLGFGGVWAFVEQIGTGTGLSSKSVGTILSLTYLTAMLGSAVAAWQDNRSGYRLPYLVAMLLMGASMLGLLFATSPLIFIGAMSLMNFAWNYAITYQFSAVFKHDSSGRMAVFIILVEATGLMLGPAIAGYLVQTSGLDAALYLGLASGLASLALLLRRTPSNRYRS
jgi:predicted MFS family arabinose efflux permease